MVGGYIAGELEVQPLKGAVGGSARRPAVPLADTSIFVWIGAEVPRPEGGSRKEEKEKTSFG